MPQTLTPLLLVATLLLASPALTQESARPSPTLSWAGEEVEIAMPSSDGRSLVEVYVGDAGPFDFLIDTGASVSVLDTSTMELLNLEIVETTEIGAPGGGKVPTDVVKAPPITVGGLTVANAHPIVLGISKMTGGIIEGVLGMDLFADVVLALDPASARATVSRRALSEGDQGVIALDMSGGLLNFPITVAGRTVVAHIDTGAPGGITLPIELMDQLPLVPGAGQTGTANLVGGGRTLTIRTLDGTVQIGDREYQNPKVTFMDPSPGAANLGAGLMAELVLTIDQQNGLMFIGPSLPAGKAGPSKAKTPGSSSWFTEFSGDSVVIPSTFNGRHTVVEAELDGADAFNAIVDTGSGVNLIDPALVETMGFEKTSEMTVMSGGTDPITADIVILPELRIGDLTIRNAPFLALQMLGAERAIVGMAAFSGHLLTIDAANDQIIVSKGSLAANDPDVVSFTQTRSIQIDVAVNGTAFPVTLDTGSRHGLILPYSMRSTVTLAGELEKMPDARLIGGTRTMWKGKLDGTLSIAGLTYENPDVLFMDPAASGNIGGQIIRDAKLTIDQNNGLLALRPYSEKIHRPAPVQVRRVGVGFNPAADQPAVRSIDPGSKADLGGLRVGDIILSLNGKQISEHGPALGPLFQGTTPCCSRSNGPPNA